MKQREFWLDYLRAFGCILVTVGHLLLSFQDAQIIPAKLAVSVFIGVIYRFHVHIFFFCSGYLFQSGKEKIANLNLYRIEKSLNFLTLYILFTVITYFMKTVFSSSVNTAVAHSLPDTLLKYPINQMWYLSTISVFFLLAHPIQSDKSASVLLSAALAAKLVSFSYLSAEFPLTVLYLFQNLIWFVMGQLFAYKQTKPSIFVSLLSVLLFYVLFTRGNLIPLRSEVRDSILTFLGVTASAGIIYHLTKGKTAITFPWNYLAKCMLQIYLLHTISAAAIRSVLFKLGIIHPLPHILFGLIFSFVVPILCGVIAERVKFLNFFFFPVKTAKEFRTEKKQRSR